MIKKAQKTGILLAKETLRIAAWALLSVTGIGSLFTLKKSGGALTSIIKAYIISITLVILIFAIIIIQKRKSIFKTK